MKCMCLVLLTRSWIRKTTKLAGTKDMAKITQMETRTSTEVVTLEIEKKQQAVSHVKAITARGASEELSVVK